jgi:hypothetical protein
MHRLQVALGLALVIAVGCAGSQPVRLQLTPGARIGILNVLEQDMTHVHVGALRIDSFTNVYPVDWDLPAYLNRTIENDLRAHGSYTLIPLAVNADAGRKRSIAEDITRTLNTWMPRGLRAYLEQVVEENRLDAVISVSSYNSRTWEGDVCFTIGKDHVVSTQGYGLFTRARLLSGLSGRLPIGRNQAAPFADILVAVFEPRPPALAAFATASCSQETLADVPGGSDLRFLGPDVIKQVRPFVEQLGAESVRTALGKAGLIP